MLLLYLFSISLEDTQQVISLLSGIQFVPHESTMKLRAIVDIPSPLSQDSSSASIAARITLILTKSSPSVDMGWTLVAHEVDLFSLFYLFFFSFLFSLFMRSSRSR